MKPTLAARIARTLQAMQNCIASGNQEWEEKRAALLTLVTKLPAGSGIDNGIALCFDRSTPERLVFTLSFHHMDESGSYDGWTTHNVIVQASLPFGGLRLRITGRDRVRVKDYLYDVLTAALSCCEQDEPRGNPATRALKEEK